MSATGPRTAVTIVGGGVHVVSLLEAAASRADLPPLDLRLVARDAARLDTIARHAEQVVARARPDWSLRSTTDLAEGVGDAAVVVLLVRVGGAAARAHDEHFPTVCGLVGDEGIGAGGIANAWRTAPVLAGMAEVLATSAADALVLNMVAPLGITTRLLTGHGLRTVGICELPTVVLDRLAAAGADPDACSVGGLNHLSWVWPRDPADARAAATLGEAGPAAGLVHPSTFEHFGGVPMPYYYRVLEPALGEQLGLVQPPGRAQQLESLSKAALERMGRAPGAHIAELAGRPTPWFDLATVPVLAAWLGGAAWSGTVNVANEHRLEGLDPDVVVEVPARVRRGEVLAGAPGPPPPQIQDFLTAWGHTEALTHRAVTTRDVGQLEQALASLPLPLPPGAVDTLRTRVLDAAGLAA